jgi:hypothetical protein
MDFGVRNLSIGVSSADNVKAAARDTSSGCGLVSADMDLRLKSGHDACRTAGLDRLGRTAEALPMACVLLQQTRLWIPRACARGQNRG